MKYQSCDEISRTPVREKIENVDKTPLNISDPGSNTFNQPTTKPLCYHGEWLGIGLKSNIDEKPVHTYFKLM